MWFSVYDTVTAIIFDVQSLLIHLSREEFRVFCFSYVERLLPQIEPEDEEGGALSLVSSVVFVFTRFGCSFHLHSFRV